MKYKKLAKITDVQIYARIEDDGKSYINCTDQNLDFIEWVEEGNTPEEAD